MLGSSPRPWGTQAAGSALRYAWRFIPTPVGNTGATAYLEALLSVHPHARGEHVAMSCALQGLRGSSPRPWGTPEHARSWGRQRRFIPTPVGNTPIKGNFGIENSVHPHARGEHKPWRPTGKYTPGSSPRPWGTRLKFGRALLNRRFIPTPVGNTLKSSICPTW